jgi:replicative DNA helicase
MTHKIIDDIERAELKSHLLEFLQDHCKIEISRRENFSCVNPDHQDSTASMHYYDDSDLVYCFGGCRKSYDIFDCIGFVYPTARGSYSAQVKIARELYGNAAAYLSLSAKELPKKTGSAAGKAKELPPDQSENYANWHAAIKESEKAIEYITSKRQIPLQLINDFRIGYDASRKSIIFPVNPHFYITRSITGTGKFMQPEHCLTTIFNRLALHSGKPVFVTESIIDALSIMALGFQAVSLNSSNFWKRLPEYIASTNINAPLIILALDNDEAGESAAADLEARLTDMGIETRRLKYPAGECKDANELLLQDRQAMMAACAEAADKEEVKPVKETKATPPPAPEQMTPEQNGKDSKKAKAAQRIAAARGSAGLDSIFEHDPKAAGLPTEFKRFNKILSGDDASGFIEGFYIVMGAPGVGKTSFCVQLAADFCRQGKLVFYLHMEQSRAELQRKIISCLTHKIDTGSAADISDIRKFHKIKGAKRANLEQAKASFTAYADNLHIYEDTGDDAPAIKELLDDFNLVYGRMPDVMFIDYLQILPPLDSRTWSDKQKADMNVTLLRKLARKHKIPIIAISSVNRDSYDKPLSLKSIKESGGVEGGADVVIGVQAPGIEATYEKRTGKYEFSYDNYLKNGCEPDGRRIVEIVTLKNRGTPLGSHIFKFYGRHHRITE